MALVNLHFNDTIDEAAKKFKDEIIPAAVNAFTDEILPALRNAGADFIDGVEVEFTCNFKFRRKPPSPILDPKGS